MKIGSTESFQIIIFVKADGQIVENTLPQLILANGIGGFKVLKKQNCFHFALRAGTGHHAAAVLANECCRLMASLTAEAYTAPRRASIKTAGGSVLELY
jgi:hypothetical protein